MILTDKLSNIANAIRSKTGKSEEMTLDEMPVEIEGIFGNKVEKPFDCHSVTFVYGDKSYVRSVADGDTCADPVERGLIPTPTKESTAQYNYTFYGWGASDGGAADANILKNITEDKTVYAIFTATVRYYTITWLDDDGVTELPGQKQWAYGTVPSYTPTKSGKAFDKWTPTPVPVTGNASYTASWKSAIASGTCGDTATWLLDANGVLTISGTGDMKNYVYKMVSSKIVPGTPWWYHASKINTVIVEDGITRIGNLAFEQCANLTTATISNSVTYIGSSAFKKCTGLTSITIPDGVTYIDSHAFSGCTGLTSLIIPDSVTRIKVGVFDSCKNLNYNAYDNATYLGNAENPYVVLVKANSTSITSCTIHPNTKVIYEEAFYNCTGLTNITIPYGVVSIESNVFQRCTGLTDVSIPGSVAAVGFYAFGDCTNLASITFEQTDGWVATSDTDATNVVSVDVSDPATNVTHLVTTYKRYWWTRS